MVINNSVELAMILEAACKNKSLAIDATCGNGNDTLRLASKFKKVIAFDIQSEAINSTRTKLMESNVKNVTLVQDSHSRVSMYLSPDDTIDLIMFNLGYLPGQDKSIHTDPLQVIDSFESSQNFMNKGSAIIIVMYPGFEAGLMEKDHILSYFSSLDQKKYSVIHSRFINQKGMPPELILISRIRD